MTDYNGLSKQRKDILSVINVLKKATPGDITSKNPEIKNTYTQLDRLLQDGFVKRVSEREYALTEKGEYIFEKKTIKKQRPIEFSDEEVTLFEKLAKQPNWINKLAEQLNPALLGLVEERKAALLGLVSNADVHGDRNRIHVLLSGPTSVGKSKIIEWSRDFLWGYFMDPSSKKAGMEGTGKGYQFSEGLLQKADNSTLYIDELDKLPSVEQTTLLRAMESGKIEVNKDRVSRSSDARIRVIATCNDKSRIIEPLQSRFDLQLEVEELSKDKRDSLIIKRFNDWNRPKIASEEDFSLKRYLMYASQIESHLPEDRESLALYTKSQLNWGQLQNKDIRQIESIPRLMIALAKLKLKPSADNEDLKEIIELIKR